MYAPASIWLCLGDHTGAGRAWHRRLDSIHQPEALVNWRNLIPISPDQLHGTPCLQGTRVPVYVVLDNLAAGEAAEAILDQYPSLRPEHIPAALAFAVELAHERVVPIPA